MAKAKVSAMGLIMRSSSRHPGQTGCRGARSGAKARVEIVGPQIAPKKIRRPVPCSCDWNEMEHVSYRLPGGDLIVFRVARLKGDKGGVYPTVEPIDWRGAFVPDAETLLRAPIRPIEREWYAKYRRRIDSTDPIPPAASRLWIVRLRAHQKNDRFHRFGILRSPAWKDANPYLSYARTTPVMGVIVVAPKELDEKLATVFGFR
jgi:hypothetical protein